MGEIATDEFLAEIRRSHTIISWIDVTSPTNETTRLAATGGSITDDATAETRRRCSVTCYDATGSLTPKSAQDLLTPYGTEIRPYRGVIYADGRTEVIPLGVYRISQVDVEDQVGGSPDIKIEGFDRSRTVMRDKFIEPYTVAKDTKLVDAIKKIIARTFPDVEWDAISKDMAATAPLVYDANTSPWEAATALAKSLGCELYFSATGKLVLAPPADAKANPAPDFDYIEGKGCTMTTFASRFTDDPGYNGVILEGASVGDDKPPVRAVAWDDEPTSPTYRKGPYGEVPTFIQDENITKQEDADNAVKSLLQAQLGFSQQVTITCWPNPALHSGSIIKVERKRSGATGLYTIDSHTIPMQASETATIVARKSGTTVNPEGGGDGG
jgi:hypothetical protein